MTSLHFTVVPFDLIFCFFSSKEKIQRINYYFWKSPYYKGKSPKIPADSIADNNHLEFLR